MRGSPDEPPVWLPQPPPPRRVPDVGLTTTTLAVGLIATVGVICFAMSWSAIIGDVFRWARWTLVSVQVALWSLTVGLVVWHWERGLSGLWVSLTGGFLATAFFWVSVFLLVASMPCPSFC